MLLSITACPIHTLLPLGRAAPLDNEYAQGSESGTGFAIGDHIAIEPPKISETSGLLILEKPGISGLLRHEGSLLLLVMVVLVLSFGLPFLKSHGAWISLPCWFYKITGIPCLACGMTRSFVFSAQGQWSSAFEMHLLGPPLFFATWAFGAYLVVALSSGYRLKFNLSNKTRGVITLIVLGILVTAWILKLIYFPASWR